MAEAELPSSEALRRNALNRSAQRNATVARRRLFWRWVGWVANQVLRWVLLPALLIAAAVSALHHGTPPAAGPLATPPTPDAPPAHEPALQLRMDEEQSPYERKPQRAPQAQSGASPIAHDRSSRER